MVTRKMTSCSFRFQDGSFDTLVFACIQYDFWNSSARCWSKQRSALSDIVGNIIGRMLAVGIAQGVLF